VTGEHPIEPTVEIVLFDLGGVLIEVTDASLRELGALSGIGTNDEVWRRWLACRWVRQFEAGGCGVEEFSHGFVDDWELAISPAEFLAVFGGWQHDPFPGAAELVGDVAAAGVRVGCLSNTNTHQWEAQFDGLPLVDAFEFRFLSFELGLVKPDRAIFDAVAARLPAPPERVLFLDDNAVNVEAASAFGFVARHVRGVDEARRALVERGVLAA
jgi:putative hydrolase of the HAD superfamily